MKTTAKPMTKCGCPASDCIDFSKLSSFESQKMAPAMKTVAKPMTKGALAESLAAGTEIKKSQCAKLLNTLAETAAAEVKKAGVFTIPGLCRIKTRVKPATKAGQREIF